MSAANRKNRPGQAAEDGTQNAMRGSRLGALDLDLDLLDTPDAGPRVVRGSVLRIAGYVAGVLISTAAAAVLIRYLGAAGYGRYVTVISLVTLVGGLTEAGMTNIGVREYTIRDGIDRDRLMSSLLGLRTVLTVAGVLVATGFAVLAGYESAMIWGTLVAGLGLVLVVLQNTVAVPLSSALRLGMVSVLDLLRQVATLAFVVALVLAGVGLVSLLAIPVPVGLVVLAATVLLVRGHVPLLPTFDRGQWMRLLRITLPFAAATAVGTIYIFVTVIIMSLISTEQETGFFGASFRVFNVLAGVPFLLMTSAFPVLARAARDSHRRLSYGLQRLFEISLTVGSWLALMTALGAPLAIHIVAGTEFDASIPVLRIQALALLGTFMVAAWAFVMLSLKRHAELLIANGLVLVLSIVLTLVLVPQAGAEGAAVANVAGEFTLAAAYAIFLLRSRPDLRVSLAVVPRIALAIGVATLPAVVPGLPLIAVLAASTALYVLALVILKAVPPEVAHLVSVRTGART